MDPQPQLVPGGPHSTTPPELTPKAPRLLAELPTELLIVICEFCDALSEYVIGGERVPYHNDNLMRFGRTCQRIQHVVQLVLYRNIVAGYTHRGAGAEARRVNLSNLIRTLWNNPGLGDHIRHISLDFVSFTPRSGAGKEQSLVYGSTYWNRCHLSRAMREHLNIGITKWVPTPPSAGQWSRQCAVPLFLLLCMAPNARTLELPNIPHDWKMDGVVHKMSDGTWRPKVVFANLTCLKLRARYNVPQNATYEDVFGGLLAATPNLKSLELCEFQAIRGKFRLPPRLTSLVLIETSIPGSDLAQIAGAAPRLEKYCTWFYDVRTQQQPQLTGDLLRPLSQLALADTLVGLSLGGSNFDKIPSDGIMRRFHALRVLGISYFSEATQHEGNRDLLIQLIKDCSQLAVLVVNGADRIGRDTLIRFATAVSRQEAPETLRKVKLIVKKYEPHLPGPRTRHSWKTLRAMAKKPVAALFRAGNVELGLHRGRREEIARWFEELGTGSEW